ncbi:Conserved hypothetical protein [Clostridium acetobutylicum EA 2018]|nr:Conserved hypothetical protein [Clostridium acetobutylicum EA 2018]
MEVKMNAKGNFNYNSAEKKNKNFMYQNLERSHCYSCDFSMSNFNYVNFRGAHFKFCNLYKCSFKHAEFIGSNLKGSDFKDAVFENTVFDSVRLEDVSFKDAKFINTIFVSTNTAAAKNLDIKNPGIRIFNEMPKLEISDNLKNAVLSAMENKYIKKSRILDTKDGGINTLSLMLLLENFDEETLIKGLTLLNSQIDRDFYTLSYITKFLENMPKE